MTFQVRSSVAQTPNAAFSSGAIAMPWRRSLLLILPILTWALGACSSGAGGGGEGGGDGKQTDSGVAVQVAPRAATLNLGGTQQFTATVTGAANSDVTWSASGGTISGTGLYTAPATAGTYRVTATSVTDTGKSASASVQVFDSAVPLSVVITPSRTSGVAPLAVFFDTTASTPGFADGSYVTASVLWNFDVDQTDPAGRYQSANGFVAAHVFEKPGTYRVRAVVFDAQGRSGVAEVTITAQAFSGTTYYVATNGIDTNTGTSMDAPVRSVRHAVEDLARPNTRVLFRKGDTFYTTHVTGSASGPVILASYEDPNSPSNQAPIIYSTAADTDWETLTLGNDWRAMDLHIRSGGNTAGTYGKSGGPRYPGGMSAGDDSLIYRVELENLGGDALTLGSNIMAECNVHDFSGYGVWSAGANGGALIGNRFHDMSDDNLQHVLRIQGGSRIFLGFNEFGPNVYANYDGVTVRGDSDRVVLYRNIIYDYVTGIWPQNRNSANEYQHHCVVDSNLFINSKYEFQALALHAKDIVIRNNVFYGFSTGITVENDTVVGPSQRVNMYNNTFIAGPSTNLTAIRVDSACSGVDIRNNVMLDGAGNTSATFLDGGTTLQGTSDYNTLWGPSWTTEANLFPAGSLSAWQSASGLDAHSAVLNPAIPVLDPSARANGSFARPSSTGPLVGTGTNLPGVPIDFYGNPRSGSADRGAVEYATGTPAIPGP